MIQCIIFDVLTDKFVHISLQIDLARNFSTKYHLRIGRWMYFRFLFKLLEMYTQYSQVWAQEIFVRLCVCSRHLNIYVNEHSILLPNLSFCLTNHETPFEVGMDRIYTFFLFRRFSITLDMTISILPDTIDKNLITIHYFD